MKIKENAVEKLQERRTLKLDAQKRQAGGQVKRKKPTGKWQSSKVIMKEYRAKKLKHRDHEVSREMMCACNRI